MKINMKFITQSSLRYFAVTLAICAVLFGFIYTDLKYTRLQEKYNNLLVRHDSLWDRAEYLKGGKLNIGEQYSQMYDCVREYSLSFDITDYDRAYTIYDVKEIEQCF